MKTTNWIIIKNKDRGTDYGVGSFIHILSEELSKFNFIDIFIIEISDHFSIPFEVVIRKKITYLKFSQTSFIKELDLASKHGKFSKNVIRLALQYIPKRKNNIVHINFIFQYFIARELKENLDCILIFTQHLFVYEENFNNYDIESKTYQMADHIVTVTNHGRLHLINKGVSKRKITRIYNGINPNFIQVNNSSSVLNKYGLSNNESYMIYSGRIDAIKGLQYLALAFSEIRKKFKTFKLLIAGDGDYRALISSCKFFSSNVNYLGFIPRKDLISLYKNALFGVIPSLEEHCSYVALEMLHCGLPVIASKIGGLQEIFLHESNAYLVEMVPDNSNFFGFSPDINQMIHYMNELILNKELRNKFKMNAKKEALKKFTSMEMVKKYLSTAHLNEREK